MNYVIALGLCVVAAAAEGLCAGRDPLGKLKRLNQPSWSPPTWVWVLIGVAWYSLCFISFVRLLPLWPEEKLPLILLSALMLANAAVNIPTFRIRRLDLAFFFFAPYWLLLGALMWTVFPLDRLTFVLLVIYAVYQVYAVAWGYRLWRMNRSNGA